MVDLQKEIYTTGTYSAYAVDAANPPSSAYAADAARPMNYYLKASASGYQGTIFVNGFKIRGESGSISEFISPYLKKGENKITVSYAETAELDPNASMEVEVLAGLPLKPRKEDGRKTIASWKASTTKATFFRLVGENGHLLTAENGRVGGPGQLAFAPCEDSLQLGLRYADKLQRIPSALEVINGPKQLSKVQIHFLSSTSLERVVYDEIAIAPGESRILLDDAKITVGRPLVNTGMFDSVLVVVPKNKANPAEILWRKLEVKGMPRWDTKEMVINVPALAHYSWQDAQLIGELDAKKIEALKVEVRKIHQAISKGDVETALGCWEKSTEDYCVMTGKEKTAINEVQKGQVMRLKEIGLKDTLNQLRFVKINDRVVVVETIDGHAPIETPKFNGEEFMGMNLHYAVFDGKWKIVY